MRNLLFLILIYASPVHGESLRESPLACLQKFTQKVSELASYTTTMTKTEFLDGASQTQKIKISHDIKGDRITLTYLDQGRSGIKNNGMKVSYNGTPDLAIQLGKATGFSTLVRPLVSAAAGTKMNITDSKALDGEIFTVNRAGFRFIGQILSAKLGEPRFVSALTTAPADPGFCRVVYEPSEMHFQDVTLSANESVFQLEEKYGTLAYLIYLDNQDQFKKFRALFYRERAAKLKITRDFAPFEVTIETATGLPRTFTLSREGEKLGRYEFADTQIPMEPSTP